MRIANLTDKRLNMPMRGLTNIEPLTISRNVVLTRELIKSYMVPLANIHQEKIVFIVTEDERDDFNDIFSVFPLINLRGYDDIIDYDPSEPIPPGGIVVNDPYWKDENGVIVGKDVIILPAVTVADAKPGWETPDNPDGGDKVRFIVLSWDEYLAIQNYNESALYIIYDKRYIAKGGTLLTAVRDINDLNNILLTTLQDLGMTNSTVPTSKAVVDYINHRFESAISGVEYRGLIDANNPSDNEYWIDALHGYMFRVGTAGIIDGIELGVGDTIIINKDVTGAPTAADMDVIPYTLDEIGDLRDLTTDTKENLVAAINEINDSLPRWEGIEK